MAPVPTGCSSFVSYVYNNHGISAVLLWSIMTMTVSYDTGVWCISTPILIKSFGFSSFVSYVYNNHGISAVSLWAIMTMAVSYDTGVWCISTPILIKSFILYIPI